MPTAKRSKSPRRDTPADLPWVDWDWNSDLGFVERLDEPHRVFIRAADDTSDDLFAPNRESPPTADGYELQRCRRFTILYACAQAAGLGGVDDRKHEVMISTHWPEMMARVVEQWRTDPQLRRDTLRRAFERGYLDDDPGASLDEATPEDLLGRTWFGAVVSNPFEASRLSIVRTYRQVWRGQVWADLRLRSRVPPLDISMAGLGWALLEGATDPSAPILRRMWVDDVAQVCDRDDVPLWFEQWGATASPDGGVLRIAGDLDDDMLAALRRSWNVDDAAAVPAFRRSPPSARYPPSTW